MSQRPTCGTSTTVTVGGHRHKSPPSRCRSVGQATLMVGHAHLPQITIDPGSRFTARSLATLAFGGRVPPTGHGLPNLRPLMCDSTCFFVGTRHPRRPQVRLVCRTHPSTLLHPCIHPRRTCRHQLHQTCQLLLLRPGRAHTSMVVCLTQSFMARLF